LSIDGWRAGIGEWINFPSLYQSPDYLSFHSQQYGMTFEFNGQKARAAAWGGLVFSRVY